MENYRGVWYDFRRKKYRAACQYHGKSIFIGRFDSAIAAAIAYDQTAKTLWGNCAVLNFGEYSKATSFQLTCYRLCSPDFAALTQRQAANLLNTSNSAVCVALKRLCKKCPDLFPIYRTKKQAQRYEAWMDFFVKEKF